MHRKSRLTASLFDLVVKRQQLLKTFVERFLREKQIPSSVPALAYGRQNEPVAKVAYEDYWSKRGYKVSLFGNH